ncbi:chitin synthase chs-2-like [Phymastichus coffea]|uniref:chitin synthase chs-2-like n=1 Tax=Phymastichus coffea TaxID=108790 RepID=UPI00273BAFEB|nr:chitin synthase chs-2-like [Phymastichus coffea]
MDRRYSFYPVEQDRGYGDGINTDEIDEKNTGSIDEILLWDSFKCVDPEPNTGSMAEKRWYEIMLRIIKAFLYGFLCLAILAGCIITKGAALFATSQLRKRTVPFCEYYPGRTFREQNRYEAQTSDEARSSWVWCIIIAFSIPELMNFMRFLWNCFFINWSLPRPRNIFILTCLEALHVTGVLLLFFVVLPNLDAVQGAVTFSCACLVPSILGDKVTVNVRRPGGLAYGDILAMLAQIGGIASFTLIAEPPNNAYAAWLTPIALILSSLRWWGNYVSKESQFGFVVALATVRRNLQAYRAVLIGYTSVIRVFAFIFGALLINSVQGMRPADFFHGFWMDSYNFTLTLVKDGMEEGSGVIQPANLILSIVGNRWVPLNVALIHAGAGFFVYSCSKFACKTLMQGIGFALPLNVAVAGTVISLWVVSYLRAWDECYFHKDNAEAQALDYLFFYAPTIKNYEAHWYAWIWLIWTLSQAWITMHVWYTRNERLATTSKIFVVFSYDALMIDQSLALSRWREEADDDDYVERKEDDIERNDDAYRGKEDILKEDQTTRIYACATMWHETTEEMTDFLNSILRLDKDQCIMRTMKSYDPKANLPDYYELEVHVFFDDAFRCVHGCSRRCTHDESMTLVNDYVGDFVRCVEKCVRARNFKASPPVKYPTPYGGRLVWTLPEQTKMYVHLKDKNRIRARKRWSQVMYMYYLLGYRLMAEDISVSRKEVIAENTYLLTLDGDIDFRPSAVRTLVDRMKVNRDVGSACGRIHPLGKGPLVWFQKFEYAIGHWLQKSTEHTIGCVLCSPGCFALFRAKALMENNVMRKYATVAEEARHFIQYDQGEDRWLCTLILQCGYKVEYSAASDAFTHAPEKFNEFFIQRRRWIPSTVANIFDLLETAADTKKNNRDISWLYILYQWVLMGSTILGPGTIFLMLVGAFVAAFGIDNYTSFVYNIVPILIFCSVCYFTKEQTQLVVAGIITAIYGLVMIVVLVGIMLQITEDGWLAPSTLFFFLVAGELLITGLLHPLEWSCLLYGFVYYVTVPSMYVLLVIFSLFNMNNISWGTREVPKVEVITEEQQAATATSASKSLLSKDAKNEKGPIEFSVAGLFKCILCAQDIPRENDKELKEIASALSRIDARLNDMERNINSSSSGLRSARDLSRDEASNPAAGRTTHSVNFAEKLEETIDDDSNANSDTDDDDEVASSDDEQSARENDNFLVSPNWLRSKGLGKGEVEFLSSEEEIFWKKFIETYLDPIDKDEKREADINRRITELRDQYIFKFFMINSLFVLSVFLLQLNKDVLYLEWPLGVKYNITYHDLEVSVHVVEEHLHLEPIGFMFILLFVSILAVQFIAMLLHRFETFSHIMAKVRLSCDCWNKAADLSEEAIHERQALKIRKIFERKLNSDARPAGSSNKVPPRKRRTVHFLHADNERRQTYARPFSTSIKETLHNVGETKNIADMSRKIERTIRASRSQQREKSMSSGSAADSLKQKQRKHIAGYDNKGYLYEHQETEIKM